MSEDLVAAPFLNMVMISNSEPHLRLSEPSLFQSQMRNSLCRRILQFYFIAGCHLCRFWHVSTVGRERIRPSTHRNKTGWWASRYLNPAKSSHIISLFWNAHVRVYFFFSDANESKISERSDQFKMTRFHFKTEIPSVEFSHRFWRLLLLFLKLRILVQ